MTTQHAPDRDGPPLPPERRRRPGPRLRAAGAAPPAVLLAAEPDPDSFENLAALLAVRGVHVVRSADGAELLFAAGALRPALVLVTARLPAVPLSTAIAVIRRHLDVPLFLALGDGDAELAQEGLAAGATGLVGRPYTQRELDAVLAGPLEHAVSELARTAVLRIGPLELDPLAFRVTCAGRVLDLTLREFELLRFLMLNADLAVTVDDLRDGVWGARGETATPNTIAVHIGRLRAGLAGAAEIVNIRGYGYRFRVL